MGNKGHSNRQKLYSLCVVLVLSSFISPNHIAFAVSQSDLGLLGEIEKEVQAESISDRSFEQIQILVERYPNDDHIRLLLGDCLDSLGLPTQAMEQYQTAVQLGPNDPKAVATLIKAKYKRGYVDEAEKLLDSARKRFPESSDLDFWSANFLFSKKNDDEAEKLYLKALQAGKPVPGLPTALANMKLMRKQYQVAVALADQDLEIDPKLFAAVEVKAWRLLNWASSARLAHFSSRHLRRTVAIKNCRLPTYNAFSGKATMRKHFVLPWCIYLLQPVNIPILSLPKSSVSSMIAHLSEQQIKEAIAEVSKYPMYNMRAGYHFALGDLLDRRNYHALAVAQYREGLSLSPEFGRGWYRLGLDQETVLRDYDGALVSYKKAVQYSPRDPEIANHFTRLQSRIATRKQDLAWLLKDKLKLNDLLRK